MRQDVQAHKHKSHYYNRQFENKMETTNTNDQLRSIEYSGDAKIVDP